MFRFFIRSFALALALSAGLGLFSAKDASAQFAIRGGADVRPLVYVGPETSGSLGDFGYLGLHVAPSFGFAKILQVELLADLWIPINNTETEFLLAPGLRVDLGIAYARANFAWLTTESDFGLEAGAGISILTFMYLGLNADYFFDQELFMLGAEVGVSFGL
jgi:hypothetical protein